MGQEYSSAKEAADAFVEALDQARTATDDQPGDEVSLVDPANFGFNVMADDDPFEIVLEWDADLTDVTVKWSSSNYFWYAEVEDDKVDPDRMYELGELPLPDPLERKISDEEALDMIAHWLREPEWGSGMLEDISQVVVRSGRSTDNYPGNPHTWGRH